MNNLENNIISNEIEIKITNENIIHNNIKAINNTQNIKNDFMIHVSKSEDDKFLYILVNLNKAKKIIEAKGGKMISTTLDYENAYSKLNIRCQDEHIFTCTLSNLNLNRWCPHCHIFMGELIAKCALEHLLEKPFIKVRPQWLKLDNNACLEIDAYNLEENLGMEYHGIQHYKFIRYFHKTQENFIKRLGYDKLKIELCISNNTKLIIVPYSVNHENICEFIHTELTKLGYTIPNERILSFNMTDFKDSLSKTIQIKNIIERKGGILVSGTVLDNKSLLTILCEKNHEWTTKAKYIKNDAWCHQCGIEVDDSTKRKISHSVKLYNETDKGKQIKKESHEKRSMTMQKEKDELRATTTHKICGNKNCANKDTLQPISAFNTKSDAKDGFQTNCKVCVNIIKQEWRQKQKLNI